MDMFDRERAEITALFKEDVELGLYDLTSVATYRIRSVNGTPAQHTILVSYYDDEVYMPPESCSNTNRLTVTDLDFPVRCGQVFNHANIEMRVQYPGEQVNRYDAAKVIPSGTKASLCDLLARAYQLGGYGNRHDLLNSNGISEKQAYSIAMEALGMPSCDSGAVEPVSLKSAAMESREASEALSDNVEHDGCGRDAR